MGKLFGTDGVRGVANSELTAELAYNLGRAGAYVLTEGTHKPKILVGMDTRISGDMLESALVAGICSVGAEAVVLGIVPTPAVAYLTRKYNADAGVVISASHNPVEFNGIKFFNNKGYKLPDCIEDKIESIILDGIDKDKIPSPTGVNIGRRVEAREAYKDYVEFELSTVNYRLDGLKLGIDCSNGANSHIAPDVFRKLGAEVYTIADKPDGTNINLNCGSTHIKNISKFVVENKLDLGLAFDGDADRLLVVDHEGNFVDGDKMMSICGLFMHKNGKLEKDTIVVTVMTNLGMTIMAKENGFNLAVTQVGDRYVLEEMIAKGYKIGGEQSGHIIFLDYNTTGDGLMTALRLLEVVAVEKKSLKELATVMTVLPQVLINAKVANTKKYAYLEDEVIAAEIKKIEEVFKGEGRVLIRPSGTEPLVRVMIEGKDQDMLNSYAKELAKLIEERMA
jgi:phosphoglucosamine mutase